MYLLNLQYSSPSMSLYDLLLFKATAVPKTTYLKECLLCLSGDQYYQTEYEKDEILLRLVIYKSISPLSHEV